jgi:hypothetical protein
MGLSEFKVCRSGKETSQSIELHVFEGPARNKKVFVDDMGLGIGRDPANSFCVNDDS